MKRLVFIFLLAVSFCKAADPDESWKQAVQNIHNWQQTDSLNLDSYHITTMPNNFNHTLLQTLFLNHNEMSELPAEFNLPQLRILLLNNNHLEYVNPQILEQCPKLTYLNLSHNPLSQENVDALRNAAVASSRVIKIIAEDIENEEYLRPGINMKSTARR